MRLTDKLSEIQKYLSELDSIVPHNFQDYEGDLKTKAACERYFEKIMEAVVDLAFLIIKDRGYRVPEEDKEAFDILEKEGIITKQLAGNIKDAKGMRNILAHEYGKIDDELVFHSITKELITDVRELLEIITIFTNRISQA